MTKLYIHAPNVHHGGGKTILLSILQSLSVNFTYVCILDERLTLPLDFPLGSVKRIKPALLQRFYAELWLSQNVNKRDLVICFGNLPPLFKLQGGVVVFLQNRILADRLSFKGYPLKVWIRLLIERIWLWARIKNVDHIIVQTPEMKRLLIGNTKTNIQILPVIGSKENYSRVNPDKMPKNNYNFDLIYVASGDPHKNHRRLINAWCLLAEDNVFPSLVLTLDKKVYSELCEWIDDKIALYNLKIENVGAVSHEVVLELYKKVRALIYPSTLESFGIPLLEARQAGLPILASELDYVRDVIDPEESFNPYSDVSIARAVKRHLGIREPELPLCDATSFLKKITEILN